MLDLAKEKLLHKDTGCYITIGILALCIFCTIYGVQVLNPTYTDWLLSGGDLTQQYLGWAAYRKDAWHFPIGMVESLAYPFKTSVLFTDSIPLFAIIFKVLSPILPENFQYWGIWGILCFILQGIFSAKIIKYFTENKVVIITASILFIFTPVMIWRMYVHTSLAGHWILLIGLEAILAFDQYKNNKKLYLKIAIMGALSSAIHTYFVLMNGIILLGICFLDIANCKRLKRSCYLLAVYLVSVIIVTGLLGGFNSQVSASAGGLGIFSFNLNAFINPQGWSSILPNLPLYGNGQYEGFGYFGAGWLVLILFSVGALLGSKEGLHNLKKNWKKYLPIILITIVSVCIAISPIITLGNFVIAEIELPKIIIKLWSVFRASGRIAWIAIYAIMFTCCITLIRLLNKRCLIMLLCFCLGIQVYDIHKMLQLKYEEWGYIKEYDSDLSNTQFWDAIGDKKEIEHIVYFSAMEHKRMYAITDWAIKNGKTINDFYFARSLEDKVEQHKIQALESLSTNTLFIFQNKDLHYCFKYPLHYYEIDGMIIGYVNTIEGFEETLPKELVNWDAYNFDIYTDLNGGIIKNTDIVKGSYEIEQISENYRVMWLGKDSSIILLNNKNKDSLVIRGTIPMDLLHNKAGVHNMTIRITLNGNIVAQKLYTKTQDFEIIIPKTNDLGEYLEISLNASTETNPSIFGISSDSRSLSFQLKSVTQE